MDVMFKENRQIWKLRVFNVTYFENKMLETKNLSKQSSQMSQFKHKFSRHTAAGRGPSALFVVYT